MERRRGAEPRSRSRGRRPNVVWAKKKYGEDPPKWAKAARDQEQLHLAQLLARRRKPRSCGPVVRVRAADRGSSRALTRRGCRSPPRRRAGSSRRWPTRWSTRGRLRCRANVQLYSAVIDRGPRRENPMLAAQIGAQVQMEMQAVAQHERAVRARSSRHRQAVDRRDLRRARDRPPGLRAAMSRRSGSSASTTPMSQAIMSGDPGSRDLALMAVLRPRRTSRDDAEGAHAERDERSRRRTSFAGRPRASSRAGRARAAAEASPVHGGDGGASGERRGQCVRRSELVSAASSALAGTADPANDAARNRRERGTPESQSPTDSRSFDMADLAVGPSSRPRSRSPDERVVDMDPTMRKLDPDTTQFTTMTSGRRPVRPRARR